MTINFFFKKGEHTNGTHSRKFYTFKGKQWTISDEACAIGICIKKEEKNLESNLETIHSPYQTGKMKTQVSKSRVNYRYHSRPISNRKGSNLYNVSFFRDLVIEANYIWLQARSIIDRFGEKKKLLELGKKEKQRL